MSKSDPRKQRHQSLMRMGTAVLLLAVMVFVQLQNVSAADYPLTVSLAAPTSVGGGDDLTLAVDESAPDAAYAIFSDGGGSQWYRTAVRLENNSGSEVASIRVRFVVNEGTSCSGSEPIDFQYYDEGSSSWTDISGTCLSGHWYYYFGPSGGFPVPDGYDETTQLRVGYQVPGLYLLDIQAVDVSTADVPQSNLITSHQSGGIQAAIDAVPDDYTIPVQAGVFDETINIDAHHNLTINGMGEEYTTLKSSTTLPWNVGGYGTSRQTVVRVVDSSNIDLQNMTLDFDLVKGNFIHGILYWDSSGAVQYNTLKNMGVPDGTYYEITSYFRGPGFTDAGRVGVEIVGNTFIDTGRLGINVHDYVYAQILNNTFYKTFDDFGYAIELGSESTGVISGNTVYGFDKAADSDGSSSAGIYIENSFTNDVVTGFTKDVTVENNEIYDSQYGLYIGNEFDGYAGDVDIVIDLNNNKIHDNLLGGVVIADEDKEAGSSVTVNASGNTLVNNGDSGYLLYTNGDGDITANLSGENIDGHGTGFYVTDTAGAGSASSYALDISGSTFQDNPVQILRDEPLTNSELNIPAVFAANAFDLAAYADSGAGIYSSIQDAIDSASPGDTVYVAPGTYPEDLVIDQANLTVTSTETAAETILDGTVEISADGVTLDDLTVSPSVALTSIPSSAVLVMDANHVTISNNVITGIRGDGTVSIHGIQIFGESSPYVTDFMIYNNTITDIDNAGGTTWPDYHGAVGIKVQNWVDGVEIRDNVISDIHSAGWTYGIVTTPSSVDPATPTDIVVEGNTISLSNDGSVYDVWTDPASAPYPGIGFAIDDGASAAEAALHYNSFSDIPYGAVNKDAGVSLEAVLNWWGDATGPSHSSNPHGEGQGGIAVSDDVSFAPWYATATTTEYTERVALDHFGLLAVSDTIQGALDAALAGDTVSVSDGLFEEDLVIDEDLTGLDLGGTGVGLTTIKGVAQVDAALFPLADPNIEVLADDVAIHDFTIQGPDPAVGYYSSGMVIGGANLEVFDNAFEVPNAASLDDISQGIQTYTGANNPTAGGEVDGLYLHDNTFTDFGAGTWGYEGLYINSDDGDPTPGGLVSVAYNSFSGDILRAITSERSQVEIIGNTILTDMFPIAPDFLTAGAYQGINVRSLVGAEQRDITISGNAVGGASVARGFLEGIRIGQDESQVMSGIFTAGNTYPRENVTDTVRYDLEDRLGFFVPDNYRWFIKNDFNDGWSGVSSFGWGGATELQPLVGDWDGDGVDTAAFYKPSQWRWYFKNDFADGWAGVSTLQWGGNAEMIPLAGDWDGDGDDTIGFYKPSTAEWYLKDENTEGWSGFTTVVWGGASENIPIVGDWDGDGIDTIGFFVPSLNRWYLKNDLSDGWGGETAFNFGTSDPMDPIVGDWNNDGVDDVGGYVPAKWSWFLKHDQVSGWTDIRIVRFAVTSGYEVIAGDWQ